MRSALSVAREAHAEADVVLEHPAPSLEGVAQQLGHAGVPFDPTHLHRVLDTDLGLGGDVRDGGLHHGLLPERGQDLCDVAQEGAARTEHEDSVTAQVGVVVEEKGGTVESDRRLAGAGAALHGEQLVDGGTDDLVLLGLDGRDDVEHLAGPGPLELGQQRVSAPQAGGAGSLPAGEQVVGHGHDGAAVHHDLATTGEAERVLGTGPVEGDRHGRPPVHDNRIGPRVLHVAPADVPRRALLLVDASEQERAWAVGQERHPARQGGDVVEIRGAGRDQVPEEALRPLPHGGQRLQGVVQVSLFRHDLGVRRGRGCAHRRPNSPFMPEMAGAQKSPDTPGTITLFCPLDQPLSWDFAFSSVRTLNLYPRGPSACHISEFRRTDQALFHAAPLRVAPAAATNRFSVGVSGTRSASAAHAPCQRHTLGVEPPTGVLAPAPAETNRGPGGVPPVASARRPRPVFSP